MDQSSKKVTLYYIYQLLKDYSDENHFLTQTELSNLLKTHYGVSLERKSIASAINNLIDIGFDINKGKKGKGFALFSRTFDLTEAYFLADAIYSSKVITKSSAEKLISKIFEPFSNYQRKSFDGLYKSTDTTRTSNAEVFYNVEILYQAIQKKEQVSFKYLTHDIKGKMNPRYDGYEYHVSPYFLVNNFGNYYLVCHYRDKYDDLMVYRIDYMKDISFSDKFPYVDLYSLKSINKNFSIKNYVNEHIYMFGGETIISQIELLNDNAINYCFDWFGKNVSIKEIDGKKVATITCNYNALFYWCMQYNSSIKVLSPQKLINRIIKECETTIDKYKN